MDHEGAWTTFVDSGAGTWHRPKNLAGFNRALYR
jgi:hypothetical protein